jgi:RraA family protein
MNGFRILEINRRVDPSLVRRFAAVPAANVSDVMARMTGAGPTLRPLHAGGILAGPAFTVKSRPGDNLMLHKALDLASPGDVIVVDAGGDLTNAMLGEMMLAHAQTRGLAGVVINGAVRDLDSIRSNTFPVYAAGVTHRGPYKDGPGEINVQISLNGMIVEPGDLILGDPDGVVCVPFDEAEAICAAAESKHAEETAHLQHILAGKVDRSWIDATLKKLGCNLG